MEILRCFKRGFLKKPKQKLGNILTNSSLSIISECRAGIIWGTEDFIIQALACFLPSRLPTVLMRSPKPPLDPSPPAAPTPPDHRQQQYS